ncbi:hypothetical protein JAAARDRAFT_196982 [Jaapia argillacea MUCL 33604]|uniref:Uncharacterized protein n=1 Tax=Jaapia argillacea MUCL 33604 TaxID=933084 RepID=A0A067PU56_9AGAM|nr:hypothetical protein JAAARDRAFT_196982 [Jaapia argillacea MUCL 33604]
MAWMNHLDEEPSLRVAEDIGDLSTKILASEDGLADSNKAAMGKWMAVHIDAFDVFSKAITAVGHRGYYTLHNVEGRDKTDSPPFQSATQSMRAWIRPSGWLSWRGISDNDAQNKFSPESPSYVRWGSALFSRQRSTHPFIVDTSFSDGGTRPASTTPKTVYYPPISAVREAPPVASSSSLLIDNSGASDSELRNLISRGESGSYDSDDASTGSGTSPRKGQPDIRRFSRIPLNAKSGVTYPELAHPSDDLPADDDRMSG